MRGCCGWSVRKNMELQLLVLQERKIYFWRGRFRRVAVMAFIPDRIFRKFPPVFNYPAVQIRVGTPIMSIVAYTTCVKEGSSYRLKTSCQRTGPAQTQLLKASISNGAVTVETGRELFKRHIVEGKKEHVAV